jgi:signal transduction histidine kinase
VAALLTEPLAEKIVGPGAAAVNLQNGGIPFAVHDDGPGFDRGRLPVSSGLQHMSDRLAAPGGSIEIDSRPGGGTTIAGQVPLPAAG